MQHKAVPGFPGQPFLRDKNKYEILLTICEESVKIM